MVFSFNFTAKIYRVHNGNINIAQEKGCTCVGLNYERKKCTYSKGAVGFTLTEGTFSKGYLHFEYSSLTFTTGHSLTTPRIVLFCHRHIGVSVFFLCLVLLVTFSSAIFDMRIDLNK